MSPNSVSKLKFQRLSKMFHELIIRGIFYLESFTHTFLMAVYFICQVQRLSNSGTLSCFLKWIVLSQVHVILVLHPSGLSAYSLL